MSTWWRNAGTNYGFRCISGRLVAYTAVMARVARAVAAGSRHDVTDWSNGGADPFEVTRLPQAYSLVRGEA